MDTQQSTVELSLEQKAKVKEEFRQKYPDLAALSEKLQAEKSLADQKHKSGMAKYGGTYYKKHFAEEIKFVLDAMLIDKKDRIYFYSKFPGYTKSTLDMKIRQSWNYLMDSMDPTGCYRTLWTTSSIAEDKNKTGIRIRILRETLTQADIVMPDIVEDETKNFEWKADLDKFLQEAPTGVVFRRPENKEESLNLSDDTVDDLCVTLGQLSNVEFKVTNRKIVLIKIEP